MTAYSLTPRQTECLTFIRRTLAERGIAPTYDEIREALGLAAKSGVHRLVYGLVERGHLVMQPNRRQTMALADGPSAPALVPRVPTENMLVAGYEAMKGDWGSCREAYDDARRCWDAMVNTAP